MAVNRRRFCAAIGGMAFTAGRPTEVLAVGETRRYEQSAAAFGTTIKLTTRHREEGVARTAMSAALDEVGLIESLMSIYRADSQLCQLNRTGKINGAHPLLMQTLSSAQRFSRRTQGAFDVTIQRLWELYDRARESARSPGDRELQTARQSVDYHNVTLGTDQVHLKNDARITLNGIAQGFATDRIRQILIEHGIRDALIDVGELAGLGWRESGRNWQVGIQHPRHEQAYLAVTPITDRCLATSGDYASTFTNDFLSHHIFDPSTGRSPNELSSVSVLAPTATEADALSTAFMVMGLAKSARFSAGRDGVDAMFVTKAGRVTRTSGFPIG